MSNDNNCYVFTKTFNSFLYSFFSNNIKCRCCFIKDNDLWITIKSAGNRYTL